MFNFNVDIKMYINFSKFDLYSHVTPMVHFYYKNIFLKIVISLYFFSDSPRILKGHHKFLFVCVCVRAHIVSECMHTHTYLE